MPEVIRGTRPFIKIPDDLTRKGGIGAMEGVWGARGELIMLPQLTLFGFLFRIKLWLDSVSFGLNRLPVPSFGYFGITLASTCGISDCLFSIPSAYLPDVVFLYPPSHPFTLGTLDSQQR